MKYDPDFRDVIYGESDRGYCLTSIHGRAVVVTVMENVSQLGIVRLRLRELAEQLVEVLGDDDNGGKPTNGGGNGRGGDEARAWGQHCANRK
jgi:hypothetical protein